MSAESNRSTTASKAIQMETLKGVFTVPKTNHRRDFLRENKLNLQQLQNMTCKKKQNQQNEQEQRNQRLQRQHKNQQQLYIGRRSASQQRSPMNQRQPPVPMQKQRSISQHRNFVQSQPQRCEYYGEGNHELHATTIAAVKNSGSVGTLCSKASKISYDKEIQTEDIQDETFLYNALKKCSSDFRSQVKTKYNTMDDATLNDYNDNNEREENVHFSKSDDVVLKADLSGQNLSARCAQQPSVQRSRYATDDNSDGCFPTTSILRSHVSDSNMNIAVNQPVANKSDHLLHSNMEHLTLSNSTGTQYMQQETMEQPLSGRSRYTIGSTKSQESIFQKKHRLGGREDVRLPRYLEREKKEREEKRQRDMERDPCCPIGYYALNEQERIAMLNASERKFQGLIEELNRMPMTSQTLRIRTRKIEIERELAAIEGNIRLYSKPKVYIKQMD